MTPDEDDDFSFDEPREADPGMRELRIEMVRLQAQIDQLAASARDRAAEIADLRLRLTELEERVQWLRLRHRRHLQLWSVSTLLYGAALGLLLSYLLRF